MIKNRMTTIFRVIIVLSLIALPLSCVLTKRITGDVRPQTTSVPSSTIEEICKATGVKYPLKSPTAIVYKAQRIIEIYSEDRLLKTYPVALGPFPEGAKEKSGDNRTPEGEYYMVKNISPSFGESFYISYPNIADAKRGLATGLINTKQYKTIENSIRAGGKPPYNTKLGGLILLHGTKNRDEDGLTSTDWTAGCIAMENKDIMELYHAVSSGARVPIKIVASK